MLESGHDHVQTTSTATSVAKFLAGTYDYGQCEEIDSSWYPPFREMRGSIALGGPGSDTTGENRWLAFVTGLPEYDLGDDRAEVARALETRVTPLASAKNSVEAQVAVRTLTLNKIGVSFLGLFTLAFLNRRLHCPVGHYTSESHDSAILDLAGNGQFKTNMQRVVHLAQNGAFFSPTSVYASAQIQKTHVPMTPPATALLYTLMGHSAQSEALGAAIEAFSTEYGRLQVTTRMFLCHTRILPKHCVVIVHGPKPEFVLATCADLLLAEVRALDAPRVYFHGRGDTVEIRNMDLGPINEAPLPAALYLLASVGAVLDRESQTKVSDVMQKLDSRKRGKRGLMTLAFSNKHSTTRPSVKNEILPLSFLHVPPRGSTYAAFGDRRRPRRGSAGKPPVGKPPVGKPPKRHYV
jgi:hypothetical protein